MDVSMFCVLVTWLNCASWLMNSDGSCGLVGSWFLSCAIISLRNAFWSSWPLLFVCCVVLLPLMNAYGSVVFFVFVVVMGYIPLLLAQPQRGEHQVFRRVHHFDIVLVGARSGDHVHHLFD